MSDYGSLQLALRGLVSDGIAVIPLTDSQRKALHQFKSRVESSEYVEIPHPCLCGSTDDIIVACKDRYGITLRTVLCKSCGLMRSDPYMSPITLSKFYQNDYRPIYEEAVSLGSKTLGRKITHGEHIYQFLREHDVTIPKHVFEVGCGTGGNLVPFLLRNHIVMGCDYGGNFLEVGHKLGLDLRQGGLETIGDELPHSLVMLCHALEHFWDPVSELSLLRKKLPESSLVYVELPGIYSIHQKYGSPLLFLQNAHAYHFCLQTLDYVMSLVGFERVYGEEGVQSIYRLNLSLQPISPAPELHRQVLSYLKRIDRWRQFPHPLFWLRPGVRLARKLIGPHFYEWVEKATGERR